MNIVTASTRQCLHTHHEEAIRELENLERVIEQTSLDTGLLELCGDYFEAALRDRAWDRPDSLGDREAACLDVCEQFMVSVATVTDGQIAALRQHFGTDEVYNLMSAIYLVEMGKRLDLTLERVLQ